MTSKNLLYSGYILTKSAHATPPSPMHPYLLVIFFDAPATGPELSGFRVLPLDVWETLVHRAFEFYKKGAHPSDRQLVGQNGGLLSLNLDANERITYSGVEAWASKFSQQGITSAEAQLYARHFTGVEVAELGSGPGQGLFPVFNREYVDYFQAFERQSDNRKEPRLDGQPLLIEEAGKRNATAEPEAKLKGIFARVSVLFRYFF